MNNNMYTCIASFNASYTIPPPVYLLGDPSSFACGANTHSLLSLDGYQLFSPCCWTHAKCTPQIKLHIYIDDINNIIHPIWYRNAKENRPGGFRKILPNIRKSLIEYFWLSLQRSFKIPNLIPQRMLNHAHNYLRVYEIAAKRQKLFGGESQRTIALYWTVWREATVE